MEARFMIENPQQVEATMKITMTIKDWESLRDELNNTHPSWLLSSKINDLLSQARKVFYPKIGED